MLYIIKLYWYYFRLKKSFGVELGIALFLLVWSGLSLFTDLKNVPFSWVGFIVPIVILLYDVFSVVGFINKALGITKARRTYLSSYDFSNVKPPKNIYFQYEKLSLSRGLVFYSPKLNEHLYNENTKVPLERTKNSIDKNKYKEIRKNINQNDENYIPILAKMSLFCKNEGKLFNDDKKLCLSREIYINQDIKVHFGSFYDFYLTNLVCGKVLKDNNSGQVINTAIPYPIDDDNHLKTIEDSGLSNDIGVSTLGFTEDNHLVIFKQNNAVISSCDLLVPSGSGSSDKKDYEEDSFLKTVIKGMERELKEECCLKKEQASNFKTLLIGYFRWLEKGGKPEFIGITKMHGVEYSDIRPQAKEVCHRSEVSVSKGTLINEITTLLSKKEKLSVPLEAALFMLKKYLERNDKISEEIYDFIFEKAAH